MTPTTSSANLHIDDLHLNLNLFLILPFLCPHEMLIPFFTIERQMSERASKCARPIERKIYGRFLHGKHNVLPSIALIVCNSWRNCCCFHCRKNHSEYTSEMALDFHINQVLNAITVNFVTAHEKDTAWGFGRKSIENDVIHLLRVVIRWN